LALRVHLDAAVAAPTTYLAATWWWLRGKRLRARSRLAPLLGLSPLAYRLWIERKEPAAAAGEITAPPLAIVALITDGVEGAELDATLRSLEDAGVPALVVGEMQCTRATVVASLAKAAEAIDWQGKPWLMPMAAGDTLAPAAVRAYRAGLAGTSTRIAYADDDLVEGTGARAKPHFKPDWNSELFRHFDYLTGACIVQASKSQLASLCGTADWPRHLTDLAVAESTPLHIRQILHHRRSRPRPRIPARPGAAEGDLPSVSVIIPTRNRADLLETCLKGLAATDYPDIEIIIVDNDSDDPCTLAFLHALNPAQCRVLRHSGPFNFAAINNRAAQQANGRVLCLLNNDIEVLRSDWLSTMVRQSLRAEVGAVGAQLLYPDGRIQHAGVVLGVGGGAAHCHRLLRPEEKGYFRRHQLPQYVSAVTAACLVVQRDRFMAVGGFDADDFPVAFNDVDLCVRLNRRGWQAFYEPRAKLVHHESVSRGLDLDPVGAQRFAGELAALKCKWETDTLVDPFHHPSLSPYSERFVVAL
jgi:O-antigen biosynthesis protein